MAAAAHVAAATSGIELLLRNADPGAATSAEGSPWVLSTRRADIQLEVYHAVVPGSSFLRFKAVCVVPFAPAVVAAFMGDGARRLQWDPNVARLDSLPVEHPPPRGRVYLLHSQTKAVGPISSRDFVDVVAVVELPGGAHANGGGSVVDARLPEQRGIVRGWNSAGGGWTFVPIAPAAGAAAPRRVETRVTYVIHSDLKGWLPALVVNSAITSNYVTFFEGALKAMAAAKLDTPESHAAALAALEAAAAR